MMLKYRCCLVVTKTDEFNGFLPLVECIWGACPKTTNKGVFGIDCLCETKPKAL